MEDLMRSSSSTTRMRPLTNLHSADPDLGRPDGSTDHAKGLLALWRGRVVEVLHLRVPDHRPEGTVRPQVGCVQAEALVDRLVGGGAHAGGGARTSLQERLFDGRVR